MISLIHSGSNLCNSWRSLGLITSHHHWNKIKSFIFAYCLLLRGSKFFFLCWLPTLFSIQHNSFTSAFFCATGSPNPSGFERLWVKRILGRLVSIGGPILARKGWASDIGYSACFPITPGSSYFNSFSLLLFNEFIMKLGTSTSK